MGPTSFLFLVQHRTPNTLSFLRIAHEASSRPVGSTSLLLSTLDRPSSKKSCFAFPIKHDILFCAPVKLGITICIAHQAWHHNFHLPSSMASRFASPVQIHLVLHRPSRSSLVHIALQAASCLQSPNNIAHGTFSLSLHCPNIFFTSIHRPWTLSSPSMSLRTAYEASSFPYPLFIMFLIESRSKCPFFVVIGISGEILQRKQVRFCFLIRF